MNTPPIPTWAHSPEQCAGERCIFHNPTAHGMNDWPYILRLSGLVERLCPCGVGHPDPDSVAWFESQGWPGYGIHGCCGRCDCGPLTVENPAANGPGGSNE